MIKPMMIAGAASLLAACALPSVDRDPDIDQVYSPVSVAGEVATTEEREACSAAGGTIQRDGLRGWERCTQSLADANEACHDSTDCIGRCQITGEFLDAGVRTDAGQCQPTDSPFGCFQEVKNGKADAALCVD